MKKILSLLIASSIIAVGITSSSLQASASMKNITRITWEHAGDLEAQNGFDKNIGVAGVLSGILDNKYVVVGGGANFPYDTVLNGGQKKTYSDLYLLEKNNGKLVVKEHTNLPNEIAYGSSVTTNKGIYYIGGSTNKDAANDITLITLDESNKLKYEKVGDLPFTLSNGIAAEYNGKLYIGLGSQNGKDSTKLYEYDLKTNEIKELASLTEKSSMNQCVAQILNGNLYVFSGGGSIANTDGYKYDISSNTWSKVSNVKLGDKEISLYGANSVKLNEDEMLVIGGFDKAVYDNAVYNLGSLKGDELAKFRQNYFGADPYEFNWNKEILVYNCKSDSWTSLGQVPFDAPCGEGLVLLDENIFSINGEIKPGIRTNRMYSGNLLNK
ncbi:cyclically-permuted mutarotase family protein [Clostridium butyricum]|uniref:cyclically-permuted mutarotase family protein n=1 Tax=Clostridium butyricum TaxID=1492 RepID=UPI001CAA0B76|nr:cyclically-permuted mutarotase family protein [Clostridium butyricum]MBZ0313944.1 cyclically-permuted mutarotase family protein [Clostridium butyricum]